MTTTPNEGLLRRQLGWIVWGIGSGVYLLAVFHRTSLGVAGPLAEQRFALSAAQLGTFIMLQLGIYAAMQIPTGILIDRFGPRKMLLAATTIMGLAQVMFALVGNYPLALIARGLLGCGDAMTYISVLRLASAHFPARRYAVITSFTGLLGSLGNLIATLPLTAMLGGIGWTPTFVIAGSLSLAYGLLLLRPAVRRPIRAAAARTVDSSVGGRRVIAEVKLAWRVPAGRLGFWVHLTTMSGPVVFSVLWGFPYLTAGLGYQESFASSLLLIFVVVGSVTSLVIGLVVSRRPAVRTPLAIGVAVGGLVAWLLLIGWPGGHPPVAAVVVAVCLLATGGPASAVGFLLARDYNPRHRISTATGMVNVGGFAGSVLGVYVVGQILDLVDSGAEEHSITAFRWAFGAVVLLTVFGISRMVSWWLKARAAVLIAAAWGEEVPVTIRQHRWELVDSALLAEIASRSAAHFGSQDSDGQSIADRTVDEIPDDADDQGHGADPATANAPGDAQDAGTAAPADPAGAPPTEAHRDDDAR